MGQSDRKRSKRLRSGAPERLDPPSVATSDIEAAEKAIDLRNKVIHEGKEPIESDIPYIESVIRIIVDLSDTLILMFPSANVGNCLFPPT
jgi:hypothetical protein